VERRFVVFLASITLIWGSWIALQAYLESKRPKQAKQPEKPVAKADAKPNAGEQPVDPTEAGPKPPAEVAAEAKPAPPAEERPAAPHKWTALGSADPASGYPGVFYFNSRGAALECMELNGKNYKSVEDYTGYLGRLEPSHAIEGGAQVNVVGAGTPAALAKAAGNVPVGLAVGDVIQEIDGKPVSGGSDLYEYLRTKTKPKQKVVLSVARGDAKEPLEFTAVLTRRPLELVHPESHEYKMPNGMNQPKSYDPLSLLTTLETVGRPLKGEQEEKIANLLYDSNWTIEQQGDDFVEFSFTLDKATLAGAKIDNAGPLKIVKRYSLAKAEKPGETPYHLNLQISVHNEGDAAVPVAYRLNGLTGLPLEGWWYSTKLSPKWMTGAGARDIAYDQQGIGHRLLGCPQIVSDSRKVQKEDKDKPAQISILVGDQAAPMKYVGVDTQFFAGVVEPQPVGPEQPIKFRSAYAKPVQDLQWIPKTRLRTADVSFELNTAPVTVEPKSALKHEYRIFLGPKDPKVLSRYGLDALIEYGWPIFKHPAIWLRSVLEGLYWLTRLVGLPNYGIAIILLTVIVRSCMIPVSLKQARSAAKMQELAPEIQKIKDKYPDDPMKQHSAVQELYKKHNFNMFGGCLPVFIQLPIFIGLYRCLSVDIDLRDAALFSESIQWASNLAGPDKLFYWKDWMPAFIADEADGWLGPFFNVFPLITVTLFLIQQKMFTPPATDEQTRMQQQMMTYMTVFMGVMFYKVPAGLCIYFITSSLWGICERKLLPKPKPKDTSGGADRGGSGGGGIMARPPAKPTSPNGSGKPPASKRPKQKR